MTSDIPSQRFLGPQASLLAGGALVLFGLSRRSLGGLALALAGGALVCRGVRLVTCPTGDNCPPWRPFGARAEALLAAVGPGVNAGTFDQIAQAAKEKRHPAGTLIDESDMVDEASDDSFPASDPPAWTARG